VRAQRLGFTLAARLSGNRASVLVLRGDIDSPFSLSSSYSERPLLAECGLRPSGRRRRQSIGVHVPYEPNRVWNLAPLRAPSWGSAWSIKAAIIPLHLTAESARLDEQALQGSVSGFRKNGNGEVARYLLIQAPRGDRSQDCTLA